MQIKDSPLRYDASSSLANLHHGLYQFSPTQRIECLVRNVESPFYCMGQENEAQRLQRQVVEDEVQVIILNIEFATEVCILRTIELTFEKKIAPVKYL